MDEFVVAVFVTQLVITTGLLLLAARHLRGIKFVVVAGLFCWKFLLDPLLAIAQAVTALAGS